MAKIKEVLQSEVHWQVPNLQAGPMANNRLKTLLEGDASYFAKVYVTPAGYYWSVADTQGWQPLGAVSDETQTQARLLLSTLLERAISRRPTEKARLESIFTVPNDDFLFVRNNGTDMELLITGWGFANFKRATAGPIIDPEKQTVREAVTISFVIDGRAIANREFKYMQGTRWSESCFTDNNGLYDFGIPTIGHHFLLEDQKTGFQREFTVAEDTTHVDLDVTEYTTVRVNARRDGVDVHGESAMVNYGYRSAEIQIFNGTGTVRFPWFEDEFCTVVYDGQSVRRQLTKNTDNVFDFNIATPATPKTRIEINVHSDGNGIANEAVRLIAGSQSYNLFTNSQGKAIVELDTPQTPTDAVAHVRDQQATKRIEGELVVFDFVFDTVPTVEFDAFLRVINASGDPMPQYPVTVDTGDGPIDYLTDPTGCIALNGVVSGETMTACDTHSPNFNATYNLDYHQREYIFQLPYTSGNELQDMTLRVILKGNRPGVGLTAILQQDDHRQTAILDQQGEMNFSSEFFTTDKPVEVSLYSTERVFPKLPLQLEKDEKEYELYEVDGPFPIWKIIGEAALALGGALLLIFNYYFLTGFLPNLPNFFG